LGEIKDQDGFEAMVFGSLQSDAEGNGGGTVMPTPPSAHREYRGSSAAPTLQGEAFQFADNFIDDRITDSRRFEAGDRPQIVSATGSICRKNTYDEFRG
jgi:hypothetical protein